MQCDFKVVIDPWVKRFIESPHRFNVVNYSRQTGKSTGLVLRSAWRGLVRRQTQIMISASERQATELSRKTASILVPAGILDPKRDKISATEIARPGLRMVFLPPNPTTIRGFTGDVRKDEHAMIKDHKEVWAATFPMVTRINGEMDCCSTPKGIKDRFSRLCRKRKNTSWNYMRCTLRDAIDQGADLDYDQIYEDMDDDEMFRQEYLCEFLDEATAYLTWAEICRCRRAEMPKENHGPGDVPPGCPIFIGVDLGRKKHLTCIWSAYELDGNLISFDVRTMQRMRFQDQYDTLCAVIERPNVSKVCIDATYESNIAEALHDKYGNIVEPYVFTNKSKNEAAGYLRRRIQRETLAIPDEDRIVSDFHSVRRDVTTAGAVRLIADETDDGHADRFCAASLCCVASTRPSIELQYAEFGTPDPLEDRPGMWDEF